FQFIETRELFPGLAMADPNDVRAGLRERFHQGLAERGLAVGDEHLALLRVAGEFAQLPVVCHIGAFLWGKGGDYRLPGAVEHRPNAHALFDSFMEMSHYRRPAIELHQAETPRQAFAEKKILAVV